MLFLKFENLPSFQPSHAFTAVLLQFILPYLIGWHAFATSMKPEDASRVNNTNARSGAEFEWSR